MAKQSTTIIQRFQRLYFHSIPSRPTTSDHANLSHRLFPQSLQNPTTLGSSEAFSTGFLIPNRLSSETSSRLTFHGLPSKPMSQNGHFSHLFSSKPQTSLNNFPCGLYSDGFSSSRHLVPKTPSKLFSFVIGTRAFSSKSVGSSKSNGNSFGTSFFSLGRSASNKLHANAAQAIFDKPVSAVKSLFARYREAIGLHIEALWKRYSLAVVGAVGVALCLLLWRIMFSIASTFVGLSEGMAKYGFLALASAIVAFLGLYMRSRFTINPERVYRIVMRKLNTSAGILEVMGAPLSGTELRAYVMSGGGLRLKNFKLRLSGKRCFLIFPIRGSERKGLVSVEVKKKKGQYDMKLLAVDIPMATGPDQRLFLIGNEEEYQIGGGLVSELRDPVVKAMAAEKEFDALDQKEEEEDAKRELQEAEQKHRLEKEKLEKGSS